MPQAKSASPLILYTPDFFAALPGKPVPEEVAFFRPGLPAEAGEAEASRAVYVPANLPLAPAQAKSCLDELIRLGETHAGNLTATVLRDDFSPPENLGAGELSRGEAADLAAFAASGEAPKPKAAPSPEEEKRRRLIQAQKMLLMGYSLEKSILDAGSLISSTQNAYTALADSLGTERYNLNLGGTGDLGRPDWSRMFSAMLLFVPEGTYFYTAHDDIVALLTDDGAGLAPLGAAEAAALFPVSSKKGWEFSCGRVKLEPFTGADGEASIIIPAKYGS